MSDSSKGQTSQDDCKSELSEAPSSVKSETALSECSESRDSMSGASTPVTARYVDFVSYLLKLTRILMGLI